MRGPPSRSSRCQTSLSCLVMWTWWWPCRASAQGHRVDEAVAHGCRAGEVAARKGDGA
jgi:hypothetical protein